MDNDIFTDIENQLSYMSEVEEYKCRSDKQKVKKNCKEILKLVERAREKYAQHIAIDDVIDLIHQYQANSPIEYSAEEILCDMESKIEECRTGAVTNNGK